MSTELEMLPIESIKELRAWLNTNHTSAKSIWLVTWKKNSGSFYIPYSEIVDELLCYGWIDSQPKKLDDQRTMIRISPRNPKSNWSGVNKKKVGRLLKERRMHPAGIALVDLAKKIGTWDFLIDVEQLLVPEDLKIEFEKYSKASYYFDRFPPSSRRGILEWIKTAKTDQTRRKRISECAAKAQINIKANFPKGRDKGPKE